MMTTTTGQAAPAKRFLDIETALRWAYRDELPKRQHGGRYDSRTTIGGSMTDPAGAELIRSDARDDDDRGREPGFPPALGDPHPDSIIIESAVKHLVDWTGYRFDDDGMAAMIEGVPININVIAIAIEAVSAMTGIVTHNARMGMRPHWSMERPVPKWVTGKLGGHAKVLIDETFVEVIDRHGRVRHVEARDVPEPNRHDDAITFRAPIPCPPIRKELYREGAYCPLRWLPDPASLLTERAEYSAWHAALEILADGLAGALTAIAVLPPVAALFPWINGDGAMHGHPPELFLGLRQTPHRHETREQTAAKRRTGQRRTLHEAEVTRPQAAAKGVRVRGGTA